jgi:hypothetical protein
MAEAGHNAQLD